jgi:hypothetical protein
MFPIHHLFIHHCAANRHSILVFDDVEQLLCLFGHCLSSHDIQVLGDRQSDKLDDL